MIKSEFEELYVVQRWVYEVELPNSRTLHLVEYRLYYTEEDWELVDIGQDFMGILYTLILPDAESVDPPLSVQRLKNLEFDKARQLYNETEDFLLRDLDEWLEVDISGMSEDVKSLIDLKNIKCRIADQTCRQETGVLFSEVDYNCWIQRELLQSLFLSGKSMTEFWTSSEFRKYCDDKSRIFPEHSQIIQGMPMMVNKTIYRSPNPEMEGFYYKVANEAIWSLCEGDHDLFLHYMDILE